MNFAEGLVKAVLTAAAKSGLWRWKIARGAEEQDGSWCRGGMARRAKSRFPAIAACKNAPFA